MSETSSPRRVLHLIVEGFPPARWREIEGTSSGPDDVTEFFELTGANAPEALEKIFAADTVAVWGDMPA